MIGRMIRRYDREERSMRLETELDQLSMLLRDQPACTAADIWDDTIVFWDGRELVWAWLRDDESGLIEQEFVLDIDQWDVLAGCVEAWLEAPHYSVRPELQAWLKTPRAATKSEQI
jgi:hypothetical protein